MVSYVFLKRTRKHDYSLEQTIRRIEKFQETTKSRNTRMRNVLLSLFELSLGDCTASYFLEERPSQPVMLRREFLSKYIKYSRTQPNKCFKVFAVLPYLT